MTTRMAQLKRSIWCLGAAALVLALCSKTSPLYAFNDWMDANIFFTMGKSMLSGKVLYRDVFDHKGPVLYLLYGLGWLLNHTGFIGIFVLEICGFAVFLGLGLCTAELLRGKPLHPVWCLVPAAAVAACRAFSHGGSAEELLLPFLAAALYGLVKCLTANRQMPLRTVALQGFLCGCALLLKYTVLGFYLAWVAVLAVLYLRRGWLRQLGRSCVAYLGGLALAALPWFAYFGAHHALDAWWECYFYDNLFLYKGDGRSALTLAQHLWWAVRDDLPAVCLLAAFLLWTVLSKRRGAALATLAMAAGLAFTSLMGGYLVYYGLVLAVFAPLGLAALPQKLPAKRGVCAALSVAGIAAAAAWCLLLSPNRALPGPHGGKPAPAPVCRNHPPDAQRYFTQLRHVGRRLLHRRRGTAALPLLLRDQHAAAGPVAAAMGPAGCRRCGLCGGPDRRSAERLPHLPLRRQPDLQRR